MDEFEAEQARLLKTWEYAQINDWDLMDTDPHKDEAEAAAHLIDEAPTEGFGRLLDFAQKGSLYSMNFVGWCYAVGTGVTKDWDQAQVWYRRAFEGGSDRGLLEYGAHLVWKDRNDEAEKVYEAGWQRGFVPAVYRLIRLRLRPTLSLTERLAWKPSLEWAAEAGHPAAQFMLSKYLFRGWFGVRGIPYGLKLIFAHLAAISRDGDDRPIAA